MDDYRDRKYLSAIEAAKYLGTSVKKVHRLVKDGTLRAHKAASTQLRFDLKDLRSSSGADASGRRRSRFLASRAQMC